MNAYNEINLKAGINFSFQFPESMDGDLRAVIVDSFADFHINQAEITEDTYRMLNDEISTGFLIACKGDGADDDDDDFEYPYHEQYFPMLENAIRVSADSVIVCVSFVDVDNDTSDDSEDEWD